MATNAPPTPKGPSLRERFAQWRQKQRSKKRRSKGFDFDIEAAIEALLDNPNMSNDDFAVIADIPIVNGTGKSDPAIVANRRGIAVRELARRQRDERDNPTSQSKSKRVEETLAGLPADLDEFTKQRIAEMVEDVDNLTDTANGVETRAQSSVIMTVVVVAPIVAAFLLAYETGAFFYGGDFNWHSALSWVQFGVAHLLELVLVAIVFEMAKAKRNGENKQWRVLFCFWLFFVLTSYVGQFMYLLGIYGNNGRAIPIMGMVGITLRCAACCLIDLVCAGYLGKKSKTLEKQVDELSFKGRAIKSLTEAIVSLKESILASVARQKEEDQRQERRRVEDEQVARLRNMIMEAGLNALSGVRDDNSRSSW